ncbi:MAG: hypothetical protein ACXWV8_04840 [Chitinophagaceae bacterium]
MLKKQLLMPLLIRRKNNVGWQYAEKALPVTGETNFNHVHISTNKGI